MLPARCPGFPQKKRICKGPDARRAARSATPALLLIAFGALVHGSCGAQTTTVDDIVLPGPNLIVDGVPAIPRSMEREINAYAGFRGQAWMGWHPDRGEMLMLRRATQSAQVHRISAPGAAPEQLTQLTEPVSWAMYPPRTSDYLLLTHDQGGNERHRLFRLDTGTKALTPLTDASRRVGAIVWAWPGPREEGEFIAYATIATGQQVESSQLSTEVRVMDPARPETDRLVARLPGIGWSVTSIAADRKTLALVESRSVTESYLWTLDIASATKKLLTPAATGGQAAWRQPTFDPRGARVFALTDQGSEFLRLVSIDPLTRALTPVASHAWSIDGFALSHDGRRIAYRTNEDGRSVLRVLDLDHGQVLPMPPLPPGVIGRFGWRGDHRTLAFNLSWARDPSTLWSVDTDAGTLTRWSNDRPGVDTAAFVEPELVRWKSFDGLTISGWLYLPPARFEGRRPVKMILHGGPEAQSRPSFLGRYNYLINEEGVALLMPNVRGSSGYGRTFVSLDDGRKREDSVRDAAAGLDFIRAHPRLDADRILVAGGSYGGYMSLAIATLYPERIACAISEVGIANFVSFLERTEAYRRDLRRVEYGDERDPDMRRFLEAISPLNRADRIRRPLMVVHGANDPRVPLAEAEAITQAVRKSGQTVWSIVAKNEGHGFAREENQRFRFLAGIAFARACLSHSR